MSNTPNWYAPVATDTFASGHVTQSLATHAITYAYQGTAEETGAASTSGTINTNTGAAAQWIAQPFTTTGSQTTITRIELNWSKVGTASDTTITLQTDAAGVPSGTAVPSSPTLTFPLDFVPSGATTVSFPFPVSGLSTSTKYHLVIAGTSSTSNYDKLDRGTTVTNQALISATGGVGTWSGEGHTLVFKVYDGVNGVLRNTYEDSGVRWTGLDYAMGSAANSGPVTTSREYVGNLRQLRTIAYTSGQPTTVT